MFPSCFLTLGLVFVCWGLGGRFFWWWKVLWIANDATLAGPKTCIHQFNNGFKDSRFDFVFQGFHFQGSISCDSYSDSTMRCLPVSNELLGTLLWINFHRCKCLLPMDFIVMTCVSWGEGEVLNSLLPPNEWFSFIVTVKCVQKRFVAISSFSGGSSDIPLCISCDTLNILTFELFSSHLKPYTNLKCHIRDVSKFSTTIIQNSWVSWVWYFCSGFPHSVDQKNPMVPLCPSHGRSKHVEITDSSREQLERVLLKQASPMRTPTADQVAMGSSRLRASVMLQPKNKMGHY